MLDLLNATTIKKHLQNPQNFEIEVFDSISSTNDYLKNKSVIDPSIIHVCLAEEQTAGRGRLGKSWFSPAKQNIYMSLLFHSNKPVKEFSNLSITVGKTIITALYDYGIKEHLQLKHPNDILYNNKKLAGILIETFKQKNGLLAIVIGIGLNVNMQEGSIDQPWISLQKICKSKHDRCCLAGTIIQKIMAPTNVSSI